MEYSNKTGLPSISDITSPFEDTSWFKPEHAARGGAVHGWIAADLMGLFAPPIHESYKGYIDSYLEFKPHIKDIAFIERRLSCSKGFCGQVDIVALLDDAYDNITALLDWKTSKASYKLWQTKLGGYYHLLKKNGILVGGMGTIRLREKPSPKTGRLSPLVDLIKDPKEIKECEIDFLSMFRVYQNCLNNGKIYASKEKTQEDF